MSHIKEADAPKIMEMHYIDGIDFGILHKPFYPMPRQKKIPKNSIQKSQHPTRYQRLAEKTGLISKINPNTVSENPAKRSVLLQF